MNKTTTGFTIVELLIVIVVTAILATISIVAYNGIQNRAKASITDTDMANLEKKLKAYHIEHESLPSSIADMRANGFGGVDKMKDLSGGEGYGVKRGEHGVGVHIYDPVWDLPAWVSISYWDYKRQAWVGVSYSNYAGEWSVSDSDSGWYVNPGDPSQPCQTEWLEECSSPEMGPL